MLQIIAIFAWDKRHTNVYWNDDYASDNIQKIDIALANNKLFNDAAQFHRRRNASIGN